MQLLSNVVSAGVSRRNSVFTLLLLFYYLSGEKQSVSWQCICKPAAGFVDFRIFLLSKSPPGSFDVLPGLFYIFGPYDGSGDARCHEKPVDGTLGGCLPVSCRNILQYFGHIKAALVVFRLEQCSTSAPVSEDIGLFILACEKALCQRAVRYDTYIVF